MAESFCWTREADSGSLTTRRAWPGHCGQLPKRHPASPADARTLNTESTGEQSKAFRIFFPSLKLNCLLLRKTHRWEDTAMTAINMPNHDQMIGGQATSSSSKRIFIGPQGLRAGWRLLIFLLMLVAMGAVARAVILRFLIPAGFAPEKFTPWSVAVQDAFFVPMVAIAAWVMSKIEGRKIGQ